MRREVLADWRDFASILEETPHNVAYALGALRSDLPDSVVVVSKLNLKADDPEFVTRTKTNILPHKGVPGLILLDIDLKGMPPEVKERLPEQRVPRRHLPMLDMLDILAFLDFALESSRT